MRIYANGIVSGAPLISDVIDKVSTPSLLAKVKTVERWRASGAVRPISAVDLFLCLWAMAQAYADVARQMTIMKQKRMLEDADDESATATIVLGGLGLGRRPQPADPDGDQCVKSTAVSSQGPTRQIEVLPPC